MLGAGLLAALLVDVMALMVFASVAAGHAIGTLHRIQRRLNTLDAHASATDE
jgi:uncharacterized membrane protein YqgA involved in biofilm formation